MKYLPKPEKFTYSTRDLINMIESKMDKFERSGWGRICPVNRSWQIQCRGTQLRRVLKKRPTWVLRGRHIVDTAYNDTISL